MVGGLVTEVANALAALQSPAGNTGDLYENGEVRVLQAGFDQVEVRLDLNGSKSMGPIGRWEQKPASKGRVRLGSTGEFGKWESMLSNTARSVLWAPESKRLWLDLHPFNDGRLAPLEAVYGVVQDAMVKLAHYGIGTYEPVCVTRLDVTVDVVFAHEVAGRAFMLGLASSRGPHGRRMRPHNHELETVYVETRGGKKLGLAYDKGVERKFQALGPNHWIRLEARKFWNGADAPTLESVSVEVMREVWRDRFCTLGGGRTVKPGGVVVTVGDLMKNGEISVRDGEKLIAFLELERAGLAVDAYGQKALAERRRLARQHNLRIDEQEREVDIDLRARLLEFSEAL